MLGPLPMATEISPAEAGEAEGCIQCQRGSKLVLLFLPYFFLNYEVNILFYELKFFKERMH